MASITDFSNGEIVARGGLLGRKSSKGDAK
jgi:hypothetical protein